MKFLSPGFHRINKESITYSASQEFINFGPQLKLNPKWKAVEIEYTADVMMNSKELLKKLPLLTVGIDNKNGETKENILWKQAPIILMNKFQPKTWNRVCFKIVIRLKDLANLKDNNELTYCLFNNYKIGFKTRKQHLKIGICK